MKKKLMMISVVAVSFGVWADTEAATLKFCD